MEPLAAVASRHGGVFLTRHAHEAGYTDKEIRAHIRAGEWVRLRRGAYCTRETRSANPADEGLHLLRVHAVVLALVQPAVVSHVSAAVLTGLPLHRAPLDLVHVTRPDEHTARTECGVDHHEGRLEPADVTRGAVGLLVTSPARTVVDVARTCSFRTGLVVADAALHRGLDEAVLRAMLESMRDWPGARGASRVIEMADGGAESVGESLMRHAFALGGLPVPLLQAEFRDDRGVVWARVDALFDEERTIVEFDGRVKYDDPAALWKEKLREDRLRELGYEVVRVTWADLSDPSALAAKVRAAFDRARHRRAA